jgi:DNA-binding SARP family transcriptional activator
MSVLVRLLGPVDVHHDDIVTPIKSTKRRTMLATLALAARPVSLQTLVEMLWSGNTPSSAVENLRNYAHALRTLLGTRLVTHSAAYQLRLATDELDVTLFLSLADQGARAFAAGEAATAASTYHEALALWRGEPAAGVPRSAGLGATLAGLLDRRISVFEDYCDARLAGGASSELVPDLRHHLARHPFREHAWITLMLAQYRSGDLVGALGSFNRAQTLLRRDLGVDPGPELVALHRAILDRAPHLDNPHRITSPAASAFAR